MIYISENIVAITFATLVAFGTPYEMTRVLQKHGISRLLANAAAYFWMACILTGALILAPPEASVWVMTLATPVVIWIGFVVPALVVSLARLGHSTGTVAKISAEWLTIMLAQAVVLRAVGLSSPTA